MTAPYPVVIGICLDAEGAIWVADARGPDLLRVRQGGEVVARIALPTGRFAYACMLGGDDGRSLFMLTAPPLTDPPSPTPAGRILVATVEVGHAGRP